MQGFDGRGRMETMKRRDFLKAAVVTVAVPLVAADALADPPDRIATGVPEWDESLGQGFPPGRITELHSRETIGVDLASGPDQTVITTLEVDNGTIHYHEGGIEIVPDEILIQKRLSPTQIIWADHGLTDKEIEEIKELIDIMRLDPDYRNFTLIDVDITVQHLEDAVEDWIDCTWRELEVGDVFRETPRYLPSFPRYLPEPVDFDGKSSLITQPDYPRHYNCDCHEALGGPHMYDCKMYMVLDKPHLTPLAVRSDGRQLMVWGVNCKPWTDPDPWMIPVEKDDELPDPAYLPCVACIGKCTGCETTAGLVFAPDDNE